MQLTGVDGIGCLLVTRLTQRNTIDYGRFYNCSPDAVIRPTKRQLNRNARRNSNTKFLSANIARLSFPLYEVLFVIAFAERQAAERRKKSTRDHQ